MRSASPEPSPSLGLGTCSAASSSRWSRPSCSLTWASRPSIPSRSSTYSRYCSAACISRPTAGRAAATNQRHLKCGVGVRQGLDTTAFRVPASELGPPSLQELTLAPQRRRAPKPRCRQNIRGCQAPAACRLQAGLQGPQGPRAYNSPRSAPLLRGLSCVYGPRQDVSAIHCCVSSLQGVASRP